MHEVSDAGNATEDPTFAWFFHRQNFVNWDDILMERMHLKVLKKIESECQGESYELAILANFCLMGSREKYFECWEKYKPCIFWPFWSKGSSEQVDSGKVPWNRFILIFEA